MALLKDAARALVGTPEHAEAHARTLDQAAVIAALKGQRPMSAHQSMMRDWRASGDARRNEA